MATIHLPVKASGYLQARVAYLVARARYERQEEHLRNLLGTSNTGSDLERAMLEATTKGTHREELARLSSLGTALDKASDALDLATELQRRKVAAQQSQFDADLRNLDE